MAKTSNAGSTTLFEVATDGQTVAVAESRNDDGGVGYLTAEDLRRTTFHSEKDDQTYLLSTAAEQMKKLQVRKATR